MKNCIFCKIVKGEIPAHIIWESKTYMAFLSIFPNTEGFSVVIPKKHYPSYFAKLPARVVCDLVSAAQKVARKLDKALKDVGRTGLIFEGFGVNHIHTKLVPMHGTADMKKWTPVASTMDKYFEKYEGYLSSHDSSRADDEKLAKLADKIRQS